jgi:hypothetical protein
MVLLRPLGAAALLAGAAGATQAQSLAPRPPVVAPAMVLAPPAPGVGGGTSDNLAVPLVRRPWTRPLASLLVPGTGQLLARQERGAVYLAAEVWLVARALALDRRGRRERGRYRELAFRVARSRFTPTRVDGPFTYYEAMERFVESGLFDLDPGPGFAPESDTTTFNGALWLLARRTFFANPDSSPAPDSPQYRSAIAFYRARAVTPEFQWSWRDARLEQDVFRQSIRASDEAFRSLTNYLGALLVNHLVSAVDALVSARGRRVAVPALRLEASGAGAVLVWSLPF